MKFAQHLRALTLLSASLAASAAFAASTGSSSGFVSPEVWSGPEPVVVGQPLSRAEVQADFLRWKQAGLNLHVDGENSAATDPAYAARLAQYQRESSGNAAAARPLSRAEVQADFELWKQAGLSVHAEGENSLSNDPSYAARLAKYQQLRQGSTYAGAVQQRDTQAH